MSCGSESSSTTQPSSTTAVETSAVATSTSIADTTPPPTTVEATTSSAPATTTVAPEELPPYWAIPAGIEVAVATDDGLHLLTGGSDRIINDGAFDRVVADPEGGAWLVQERSDSGSQTIRRVDDTGGDEVIVSADPETFLQLHDSGVVDGHPTMFFNVNLVRRGFGDPEQLDELYALDLTTRERRKITDVGGWETSIDVKYGGGKLVGIWTSEALVEPWSVDLDGQIDVIDFESLGLATSYTDDPQAPQSLTISADGSRVAWVTWNIAEGQSLGQRLEIVGTDGSNPRQFTLPAGPAGPGALVDRGDHLVVDSWRYIDGGATPAALIDPETGGMLVLPIEGPTAASGEWVEPPQWPITSPVAEDVTAEVRELEPQWADQPNDYADSLAQVLIADDGDGECASNARTFPNYAPGDGPFFIELRQFCDDAGAGAWYEVVVLGPMPDGSITAGATRRVMCRRGVTPDGLCV